MSMSKALMETIKNNQLQKVIDFLEYQRERFDIPKEKLEKNGQIIYANGNDGTDFDWEANNRLCEFGYGVEDGSVWAFKLLVNKDGSAEVYCYPNGEMSPIDTVKDDRFMSKLEVEELKDFMYDVADASMNWDMTLEELGIA